MYAGAPTAGKTGLMAQQATKVTRHHVEDDYTQRAAVILTSSQHGMRKPPATRKSLKWVPLRYKSPSMDPHPNRHPFSHNTALTIKLHTGLLADTITNSQL